MYQNMYVIYKISVSYIYVYKINVYNRVEVGDTYNFLCKYWYIVFWRHMQNSFVNIVISVFLFLIYECSLI